MLEDRASERRDPLLWHLLIATLVSAKFESLFIRHGMNKLDEGWPLYAAMRLLDGGVLYDDVIWVFPPGHVLPALLGTWLDPPGFIWTRVIYALFNVLVCPALYLLGRRVMTPNFALLGALLIAIANPRSHMIQALFGYRYLVISIAALLLFDRRMRTGLHRYTFIGGILGGVLVCTRISPAFATSAAVAFMTLAASRDWRDWLRDWSLFAGGLLLVAVPVTLWVGADVGIVHLWHESVIHPVAMLQPLPWPPLELPDEWTRATLTDFYVTAAFRVYWALYAGYAGGLVFLWLRALVRRERFEHTLLVGIVVWGGIFFIRSLGRSDYPHLASVLPPICLLQAHALYLLFGRAVRGRSLATFPRQLAELSVCAVAFGSWMFIQYSDYYLNPGNRGLAPVEALDGSISLWGPEQSIYRDDIVRAIVERTDEDELLLDMSASPIFHVLSGRTGPGLLDVIMPGTFLSEEAERAFVERLEANPPALVLLRRRAFDDMPERAVRRIAPQTSAWVALRYEGIPYREYTRLEEPFYILMQRREVPLTDPTDPSILEQLQID